MEHDIPFPRYSLTQTLVHASQRADKFRSLIADVRYEDRGVLFSEMFFLFATIGDHRPPRILESGRARGLSALILALCFPDSKIKSIDRDHDSADSACAEKKLRNMPNIDLLYGDSTLVLPKLVQPDDVVMIDGPKSFRALFLGMNLLAQGAAVVFLHDFHRGLPERELVERNIPEAFFSDDAEFIGRYSYLDRACWEAIEKEQRGHRKPYNALGVQQASYGPTFACIPRNSNRSYQPMIDQGTRQALIDRTRYLLNKERRKSPNT
jgi:predicted O-methyltransferase YrrM